VGLPAEDPVRAAVPADPLTRAPHRRARAEARAGLYVHVPFCAVRCTYCDFSTGRLTQPLVERWVAAIERECAWRAAAASGTAFTSVFFGGGTPSTLTPAQFARVWRALTGAFTIAPGAEVTLEANPESVREDRLEAWVRAGVNRLSMGAQGFDPRDLAVLGRVHDAARPGEAMRLARAAGIRRLSLDLMFGYPGHTMERWRATLDRTLELGPEHVSAYCFIPEAGTPLGDTSLAGTTPLPEDGEQAALYAELEPRLGAAGHACYETSNFCLPGAEARHNLVYWLRRPYVGLGPSAHGHLGGRRYGNTYDRAEWTRRLERGGAPEAESEQDTPESRAREIVMLGLRLADGVRAADHAAGDWAEVELRYGAAFERAVATGRLERAGDAWRIAARHRFVADDVIAWIDAAAADGAVDTRRPAAIIVG
jgi:oxygen-independent coproporphyrinogen-3 oxidase